MQLDASMSCQCPRPICVGRQTHVRFHIGATACNSHFNDITNATRCEAFLFCDSVLSNICHDGAVADFLTTARPICEGCWYHGVL